MSGTGKVYWGDGDHRHEVGRFTQNDDGSLDCVVEDKTLIGRLTGGMRVDSFSIGRIRENALPEEG